MGTKQVKENLAVMAIAEQSPEIKKTMEKYGYKVGENFLAPKAISSLAMMSALEKGGITFKNVVDVLKQGMNAEGYSTKKVSQFEEEIYTYPDYKVRLSAIKMFIQMMGIDKGMDVPVPVEALEEDNTDSFVNVKMHFGKPEALEHQSSEEEDESQ